jgi:hypothetical protein
MLTFAFSVAGGSINQECLGYLNRATKSIRESMDVPERAASLTIIGSILLLAGVEVCSLKLSMLNELYLFITFYATCTNYISI